MNILQTIRFFIALWASKSVYTLMRLLKRNATHFPGDVALKIDPAFLKHIKSPKKIIMVTGTNGKTSVTNMVLDVLIQDKKPLMHNALGSNILQGIASSVLAKTSIFNTSKYNLAVLEVDERSSRLIIPYLKPDYLILNNLFRDSYRRNAHVEFIINILQNTIPKTTHMIVNGDDMFALQVIQDRPHTIFSLQPISDEVTRTDSKIHDGKLCPKCFNPMSFSFVRYHHLSHFKCSLCGYTNPSSDVSASYTSIKSQQLHLHAQNQTFVIQRDHPNVNDAYNIAAIFSLFVAMQDDLDKRVDQLSRISTVASRFSEMTVKGKRIVGLLAKDQNPVANSRLCDFLTTQPQWGRLGLCFMSEVHAHETSPNEVENMAYIYDTDYEYLNECDVTQFMLGGHRRFEYQARLLLAGCKKEAMVLVESEDDEIQAIDLNKVDTIVLMYSTKNISEAMVLREQLIARIQKEFV
jgi:UDP-N-acetylmuramyl tripeptide synthase